MGWGRERGPGVRGTEWCSRPGGNIGENDGVYSRNLPDLLKYRREDSEGIQVRAFAFAVLPAFPVASRHLFRIYYSCLNLISVVPLYVRVYCTGIQATMSLPRSPLGFQAVASCWLPGGETISLDLP